MLSYLSVGGALNPHQSLLWTLPHSPTCLLCTMYVHCTVYTLLACTWLIIDHRAHIDRPTHCYSSQPLTALLKIHFTIVTAHNSHTHLLLLFSLLPFTVTQVNTLSLHSLLIHTVYCTVYTVQYTVQAHLLLFLVIGSGVCWSTLLHCYLAYFLQVFG